MHDDVTGGDDYDKSPIAPLSRRGKQSMESDRRKVAKLGDRQLFEEDLDTTDEEEGAAEPG